MTFLAQVLRIFVASPGDVAEERQLLADCIAEWNTRNAPTAQIVFLPVAWELLLVPELGDRPQSLINRRLLADADLLIGLFWTRLGTPTGVDVSGTVEEISIFQREGRHVALYFSSRPVAPDNLDTEQWTALRNFRDAIQADGLIDSFSTSDELRDKINRFLTEVARRHADDAAAARLGRLSVREAIVEQFDVWESRETGLRHRLALGLRRDLLRLARNIEWERGRIRLFLLASAIQERLDVPFWLQQARAEDELVPLLRGLLASAANGRRPPLRAAWCLSRLSPDDRRRGISPEEWPGDRPLEDDLGAAITSGDWLTMAEAIRQAMLRMDFPAAEIDHELESLAGLEWTDGILP